MVKPTTSTVIAKTVSKLTRKCAKHKLPYADTHVSQIPSAKMALRREIGKAEYKLKTLKLHA